MRNNNLRAAYAYEESLKQGYRVVLVFYGVEGYISTSQDIGKTTEEAKELVNQLNAEIGVTPEVADSALAGSMFGWHVPAAKVARDHFAQTA